MRPLRGAPHAPVLVGVNLPWTQSYCGYDFGVPPRGWRGRSPSPRDFEAELGPALRELRAHGVGAIRVFLLADGVAYPETRPYSDYARHGLAPGVKGEKLEFANPNAPPPADLTDAYVTDVRALFDLCASVGLRVIPSFLSFEALFPPHVVGDGTVKEGRGTMVLGADREAHAEHLDRFFTATLDKLLAIGDGRGGPHPAVLAWEVMNEPDWCVRKRHVSGAALSRFLAAGVDRVVAARYVASVGFLRAEVEWLTPEVNERFVQLARDGKYLHQVHYYPHVASDRLSVTNASAYGSATIVGEMAANDTARARWPDPAVADSERDPARFLLSRLEYVAESGYRMAFLWSRNASDDKSGLDAETLRQLAAFDAATTRPRDDLA